MAKAKKRKGLMARFRRKKEPEHQGPNKELFEFYCSGGCGGYFLAKLRINIDGDFIIICPKCKHEHQRVIKGGRITGERHSTSEKAGADRIMAPMSSYREESIMEHAGLEGDDSDSAIIVDDKSKKQLLWGRYSGRG